MGLIGTAKYIGMAWLGTRFLETACYSFLRLRQSSVYQTKSFNASLLFLNLLRLEFYTRSTDYLPDERPEQAAVMFVVTGLALTLLSFDQIFNTYLPRILPRFAKQKV